jgi:DNA polymerase
MTSRTKRRDAAEFVPGSADLSVLRAAAQSCQGCGLYHDATQAVFGQGSSTARLLLVGEQPGDQEDIAGAPFIGPAGRLLDRALLEAGIDRPKVFLTNAVKHFKFVPAERGKRRIHQTPSRAETVACRPWLLSEIAAVRPRLIVCLGATAAKALLGPSFRLTSHRGEIIKDEIDDAPAPFGPARILCTIHPSAVLRSKDRDATYAGLVADLRAAAVAVA